MSVPRRTLSTTKCLYMALALLTLVFQVASASTDDRTCFDYNNEELSDSRPCYAPGTKSISHCCSTQDTCVGDTLCLSQFGTLYIGSCTVKDWADGSAGRGDCPKYYDYCKSNAGWDIAVCNNTSPVWEFCCGALQGIDTCCSHDRFKISNTTDKALIQYQLETDTNTTSPSVPAANVTDTACSATGASGNKTAQIGIGAGLGVPLLIALGLLFWENRKRRAAEAMAYQPGCSESNVQQGHNYMPQGHNYESQGQNYMPQKHGYDAVQVHEAGELKPHRGELPSSAAVHELHTLKSIGMGVTFDPAKDIDSLDGKVILVTGGNAGLGKQTITYLCAHSPRRVYLAARSASKAAAGISDVRSSVPECCEIIHLPLDLTSFSSIADAASTFQRAETRLDILINNAGIMACPYSTTKEGYEVQLGTNHMGHALLTKLLLPTLLHTASTTGDARIVTLSSAGHAISVPNGLLLDQKQLEEQGTWKRYGQSKLCNVLFARELAERHPQLTSVSLHPGVIFTDLFQSLRANVFLKAGLWLYGLLFFAIPGHYKSTVGGALNQTWAATARKEDLVNGAYYKPVGVKSSGSKYARDSGLQKKLWEWTEAELEKHGY
ncbi:hypothetical protein OPT61_g2692 [Boeremia exigua]|uniref:Uncharacterized protein n=1 Tax=Boeremia exigua TaxID=749465 RepID=A0ACC2IKS4_9PLEO|nr:hypothetical protein OPT61_g2692 [Boeremia exigua]